MSLLSSAKKILEENLKATQKDRVVVLFDGAQPRIAGAFVAACREKGISCRLQRIPGNRLPSSPIPGARKALEWATVLVAPTRNSVTHSREVVEAAARGLRGVTIPGVTAKVFSAIARADDKQIREANARVLKAMRSASWARVKTPSGSDFVVRYGGRHIGVNGTDFSRRGTVSNLPAGEVFVAPLERGSDGVVSVDYYAGLIKPGDNALLRVEKGRIVGWSKGAEPLAKKLLRAGGNSMVLCEFALGTNKAHEKPVGNVLYDEKVWGTVHVAFGQNTGFGGKNEAGAHEDVVLARPSVWFGGKKFSWK
ncbi:MAG: aminopeptidase [Candidatus Micrarchaeia archaeon]|jgi:leucyl aminopeptidase (aminopeptidase T)